jgi:peptide/nickel transport system permease protein
MIATRSSDQTAKTSESPWLDTWQQFVKHTGAVIGLAIFTGIILLVLIGPYLYKLDPKYSDLPARNQGPSLTHPLGSDNLGRDLLAQNLAGGRISLAVGIVSMLLSIFLGTVIGLISGYFKKIDGPLMRFTDMFLALPLLPLLLVIIMLFRDTLRRSLGPETGIFILIVFVIGITSWMNTARIVRGEVLAIKEREFVAAANALGSNHNRVMWLHILPNVLSPILVSATLGMANAIITESALSFLGLGFPPDFPTWGRLLFDGKDFITLTPLRVVWPGVAISLVVLSVNFIGDGLRDAFDPRLRGRS